jgi:hypothetical protein
MAWRGGGWAIYDIFIWIFLNKSRPKAPGLGESKVKYGVFIFSGGLIQAAQI